MARFTSGRAEDDNALLQDDVGWANEVTQEG